MKKLIKFDDGNALFPNAIDTQNYKELEVHKNLTFFIKYVLFLSRLLGLVHHEA